MSARRKKPPKLLLKGYFDPSRPEIYNKKALWVAQKQPYNLHFRPRVIKFAQRAVTPRPDSKQKIFE
jgi:hypothetical protein